MCHLLPLTPQLGRLVFCLAAADRLTVSQTQVLQFGQVDDRDGLPPEQEGVVLAV